MRFNRRFAAAFLLLLAFGSLALTVEIYRMLPADSLWKWSFIGFAVFGYFCAMMIAVQMVFAIRDQHVPRAGISGEQKL